MFQNMNVPRINREEEIRILRSLPSGIALLYGRRRVGKTALAQRARPGADYLYIKATSPKGSFPGIDRLEERMLDGKDVIIDEFQRLGEEFIDDIVSVYEKLYHRGLWRGRLLLITSFITAAKRLYRPGSSIYQRFSIALKLRPLRAYDVIKALGLRTYLLAGGTPEYIKTLISLGPEELARRGEIELEITLLGELRSDKYARILEALYRPKKADELKRSIGVKNPHRYLRVLEGLDLVRRLHDPSREYFYFELSDNAYRLFTRYDKDDIKTIEALAFESLIRDKEFLSLILGKKVEATGYFFKDDVEIDVLAWTRRNRYAIEVKYGYVDKKREANRLKAKLAKAKLKGRKVRVIDLSDIERLLKRT